MKRFALALGCAAVALTAAASAQSQDRVFIRHHGGPAAQIDADNDGWVTRAEATNAADRIFAELDTDRDGRLSAQDRQAHHVEIRMDGGLDIDRAERDAERAARHAERAARHAEREVERHVERIEREGGHEGRRTIIIEHGDDHHGLEAPEAPHPPAPPRPPMFLMLLANSEEADLNGDGALSRDEFRAQHLRFFDASDANGDGRIRFTPPPEPPQPPAPPAPPARPR
jgi:hypothetical protein